MRWSEVGLRLYLGKGEWGKVDPHTGAVRGTDQTDYYRHSGDGQLERVPWKEVYDAITDYKERLIRRFERRYGNNARLELTPPYMTNNIFINRPCCHNSNPPAPAPAAPPAVSGRRSSTSSSSSSTKTVYLTQEDVMVFHRYFNSQPETGVDVARMISDPDYMSSVLMCWNPLVHVKRSNLQRLRQKIQMKRRQRERNHSDSSDFEPDTYKNTQDRKRGSNKRKRDTDSDSDVMPVRKSPRVNKVVSDSEESVEKENLSLKEFAATLGLIENGTDDARDKEVVRLTRSSLTKHNRINEINNQRMINNKRRMIERNNRRIRQKERVIRDNERVIQENELFIRDNESNEMTTRSSEPSTRNNERSTRNNENSIKEIEKTSKYNENKINTKATKENENKIIPKATKENEKSSKNNEKSTKDGKSKDSESKILKENNSSKSEVPQRKLKCRPPIQREYSPLEDHTIVTLVSVGGRSRLVSGNNLWRDLVSPYSRITNITRTWQSLRNRYLRYILPKLGSLHIDVALQSELRAGAARGTIKRKGNRASILHREEEMPAASNRIPPKKIDNTLSIDYNEPSTSKGPTPRKSARLDDSSRKPPNTPETSRKPPNATETTRRTPRAETSRVRSDSSSPELITPETRQSSIKKYLTRNSTNNEDKPVKSTTPRRRQLYNPRI